MILLDSKGLLRGKRLRKLPIMARLYYPFLLGHTNFYARIELDPEVIAADLSLLNDPNLCDAEVESYFAAYERVGLCLVYKARGSRWAQFDTLVSMRRDFPSAEDNKTPAPPDTVYRDWLRSLHGDDWPEYDIAGYQQSISEKRSAAGVASGGARRNKKIAVEQNEHGVGVGVVVGVGVGAVQAATQATQATQDPTSPSVSRQNSRPSLAPEAPVSTAFDPDDELA
jgi:hypothetical protein